MTLLFDGLCKVLNDVIHLVSHLGDAVHQSVGAIVPFGLGV